MSLEAFIRKLHCALETANAATTFATGGREDSLPLPGLEVTNVGPIALPLQPAQADALRAVSVQSPFGRGTETIIDVSVRSCREIPAESITLNFSWRMAIAELAERYASALGVIDETVVPELYKLVLYKSGDFFKPHKDTEKAPGMFATLVVQLPSAFSSAEFVVSHRGERKVFDNAYESEERFFATAFFADCEHELREVSGGNRIVLLYNLVRSASGHPCVELVRRDAVLDEVEIAADDWELNGGPEKIAHMLEHEYTDKNLSFQKLKGSDEQQVAILRRSGKFDLFLALVEKHEEGEPSAPSYYRRRRGYYASDDDDEGNSADRTMGEVFNTTIFLKKVIAEDDLESKMTVLEIDDEEATLNGEDLFEGLDPDKKDYSGYTGNAGPTLEYFYHRTVLLILPRSQTFAHACSCSFEEVARLVRRHAEANASNAEKTLLAAVNYAKSSRSEAYIFLADLLTVACDLKQKNAIRTLIALMGRGVRDVPGGCISSKQMRSLAKVAVAFGWKEFGSPIMNVLKNTTPAMLGHVASFATEIMGDLSAPADIVAKMITDAISSAPIHENAVGKVAYMLFQMPSCTWYRATFLSRCAKMPLSCLAACIANILDSLAEDEADRGVPAEIGKLVRKYMSLAFTRTEAKESQSHAGSVFSRLLWTCPRDDQLLGEISNAIASTNCPELLRAVLRYPDAYYEEGDPYLVPIVKARIAQLQYAQPVGNNVQPRAHVPRHPRVTTFLRSTARSF